MPASATNAANSSPEKIIEDKNTILSLNEKKLLKEYMKKHPIEVEKKAILSLENNFKIKELINTKRPSAMNREEVAMVQLYANLKGQKIAIDGIYGPKTKEAINAIQGVVIKNKEKPPVAVPKITPKIETVARNPIPNIETADKTVFTNFPTQSQFDQLSVQDRGILCITFLMAQGIKKHVAAGIVGNLLVESKTLYTKANGDSGKAFGLAQWRPARQKGLVKLSKEIGLDKHDYRAQLLYVIKELPANGGAQILNAKNAKEVARLFCKLYERPSIEHMDRRLVAAEDFHNQVDNIA